MNETLKLLRDRKSIRVYEDRPIEAEVRQAIIDATLRAPTAGNMMLYSVIDVTDQALKEKLAESCDHQPFIAKAPMVWVFCADYRRWMRKFAACGCDGGTPKGPEEGNFLLACSDTLIAAQTAVVAAESLGVGSCYIGDIMEQSEYQAELLDLPDYVLPVAMAVFGYPTEEQKARRQPDRFPQEMIVFENAYRDIGEDELEHFAEKVQVEAFYKRKHTSDFMEEMNRSVRAMLQRWKTPTEA